MSVSEAEAYLRTGFLERLAHDLRGRTSVILGSLGELEQALGGDAGRHQALLSTARRSLARILRTASKLEDTAQLDGGTAQFNRAPCDVCELVKSAVANAEMLEGRRKIHVELELPDAPLQWSMDARWMGAAFGELASNAIRYAKQRVRVQLTASKEAISMVFADDNDTGKTFAPMRFRAPEQRQGLGLGLAIAEDVIRAHGGKLDIELAEGTRVKVTLPKESSAKGGPTSRESSTS